MEHQKRMEQEKEITLARLQTVSPNLSFFDGNGVAYSRDDVIRFIREGDAIGLEYVREEFDFLRAVIKGEVQKQIVDILGYDNDQNSSRHQSG